MRNTLFGASDAICNREEDLLKLGATQILHFLKRIRPEDQLEMQ